LSKHPKIDCYEGEVIILREGDHRLKDDFFCKSDFSGKSIKKLRKYLQ